MKKNKKREDILVSVIVPVFNVEKFLEKCVNSITNQTYKNLEILLVDDGSTDNSGIICDNFSNNDNRIKVFHKKNGGLSDARNYGIERAIGSYIMFIDSDDWIENDTIELLLDKTIEEKSDIVVFGISKDYDDGRRKIRIPTVSGTYNSEESIALLNSFKCFDVSACNKFYNIKLFKGIRFPVGKLCEDFYTTYLIFSEAKIISVLNEAKYHYFQRTNSITRNKKVNMDYYFASVEQLNYIKLNYPKIISTGETCCAFAKLTLYNEKRKKNIKINNVTDIREARKYTSGVIKNSYLSLIRKIQFLIFAYLTPLYDFYLKLKG